MKGKYLARALVSLKQGLAKADQRLAPKFPDTTNGLASVKCTGNNRHYDQ